jgi:hypothetical protein
LHLLILYSNVKSFVTASHALGYIISRLRRSNLPLRYNPCTSQ